MSSALPLPNPDPADKPHLTVRPAPRREPPFDDELEQASPIGRHDQRLPMSTRERATELHAGPAAVEIGPPMPDPARWSRSLLIGIVETAAGKRPLQQLAAMFSRPVARGLSGDLERAAARGRQHWTADATVRSVHATRPSDRVAEVSATLLARRRVRAVALRLEARDGRWRCTKLHLG